MKPNLFSTCILPIAAALVMPALTSHAQDVIVSGTLTDTSLGGGNFAYTLTLNNTGTEAVQSLWLGWFDSSPFFDIASPSNPSSSAGWSSTIDGNSIMFAGTTATALAVGHSATFSFDSTSTPAQFASGTAGTSVAYGVNATQFGFENTTLHSFEFTPSVVPEPSTFGLLAAGSLGLLGAFRRKLS